VSLELEPSPTQASSDLIRRYADLLDFDKTLPMPEAHLHRHSVRNSLVYVHYCRTRAIEPVLRPIAEELPNRDRFIASLRRAKTISGDTDEWTLIYIGIAAALDTGRKPATRLDHEYGLIRYLRQAPALESLFLVLRNSFVWTTRCSNAQRVSHLSKLNIVVENGRSEFLEWCGKHVRCTWVERPEFPRTKAECGALLRADEQRLIVAWNPLLNVLENKMDNDFCGWLTSEREQFRRSHLV
jgi:hypothetical protein